MCGVYAFIGKAESHRPDGEKLDLVARLASRRGPHAHGWAGLPKREMRATEGYRPIHLLKHGALDRHAIIGHCRLSTSGVYRNVVDAQPMGLNGRYPLWIAHNGTFPGHEELAQTLGVQLQTGNDSEIIVWLIHRMAGGDNPFVHPDLQHGFVDAVEAMVARKVAPFVLLLLSEQGFGYVRVGHHPLYAWEQQEGTYYCSLRPHPDAREILDPEIGFFPFT